MDYKGKYKFWLESEYIDDATKEELLSIKDNEKEIEDRFYKEIEFGTAGLRGVIGAGTNRMNKYVVGKATQGLANFILKQPEYTKDMGVAISYDCRHKSTDFAKQAALVLNANGIKTYIFKELRPTPELSYTIRELGCISGIMITASHNPPKYNGYKAYWLDGCQVSEPRDEQIINEVNKINDYSVVKTMDEQEARDAGLYIEVLEEMDDKYIEVIKKQSLNADIVKKVANDLSIIYTPLNGTGNKPVKRVLSEIGFKNVFVVPEQENPDPDFTTVEYPNPEDPKAFTLALEYAKERNADVIIGTDPDADRIGVVVKNKNDEYEVLSGNMTGVILTEYILGEQHRKGILHKSPVVVSTIVSTEMTRAVAEHYGARLESVLTGFKYIGGKVEELERDNSGEFIFGFEESFGYLAGKHARDKDAIVSAMLICEVAAICKEKGITLYEYMQELYEKYGYYKETTVNIKHEGKEGEEKIKRIMQALRNSDITGIAGLKVMKKKDYELQTCNNFKTGILSEYKELPISNVLRYELSENSWICVRPSGTEPKVKVYFGAKADSEVQAIEMLENMKKEFMLEVEKIN
ncbi:MAG TPA: phosphoglucomutase [Clostridiales bacterium]|nr:MAG: phosphoglucomutase [Clostridiales bacterium GWD2_32_19]HCC06924.1 phosphoglucomutase [Clostridiales bacterium]